jgi:LAO/AO transport system kinase
MTKRKPKAPTRRRPLTLDHYVEGVLAGDRAILGRAISLLESNRRDHQDKAQELLHRLLPHTGGAHRVGISGVPGVGKSTFIEALGCSLTEAGKKVAVLTVDPSSGVSGGSILGDKTRMNKLSRDPNAFIRPSPTSGSLGGVHRKTRETILCCEAAGFDTLLIETVGVGQSEVAVSNMVDFFLVLMLPGAGDELQGIKRGILELADLIVVNKADANPQAAKLARREYLNALKLMRPLSDHWKPDALVCSALKNEGLDKIWRRVLEHHTALSESGDLEHKRHQQQLAWMWSMVEEQLLSAFKSNPDVRGQLKQLEKQINTGDVTATAAAKALLQSFGALN